MRKITVAKWWYQKEQTKAQRYNWTLCWGYVYENKKAKSEKFKRMFLDHSDEPTFGYEQIGYYVVGEKLKETEKAVQFELAFWNLNRVGRYVTDAPVETRWKTWVPKSVLL